MNHIQKQNETSTIEKTVDAIRDVVFGGKFPGCKTPEEMAKEAMEQCGCPKAAAEYIVKWSTIRSGTLGFATGVWGPAVSIATSAIDVVGSLLLNVQMTAAIACIGNHDISDFKVQTMVMAVSVGSAVEDICKHAGETVVKELTLAGIRAIPEAAVIRINEAIGAKIFSKLENEGAVIVLGKVVPFVGGLVSGTIDSVTTKAIGKIAVKSFINENVAKAA